MLEPRDLDKNKVKVFKGAVTGLSLREFPLFHFLSLPLFHWIFSISFS